MHDQQVEEAYYHDIECPTCHSDKVFCVECGSPVNECDCVVDSAQMEIFCAACEDVYAVDLEEIACICDPEGELICHKCNVVRESISDPWQPKDELLQNEYYQNELPMIDISQGPLAPTKAGPCRHYHQEVYLNDATSVFCSSMNNDRKHGGETQPVPDFGLYADYGWRPWWRNEFINWPDFKLPVDYDMAFEQIDSAYQRILKGEVVEIGCIGGHGRTGTMLACLYALANQEMDGSKVIEWVRSTYCPQAIEGVSQEWFVKHYIHKCLGGPDPGDKPTSGTAKTTTSGSCTEIAHYAMYLRGHRKCFAKGAACRWWDTDQKKVLTNQFTQAEKEEAEKQLDAYPLRKGGVMLERDKAASHPVEQHYAMYLEGWTTCAILGEFCKWWETDFADFKAGKLQSGVDLGAVELLRAEYKEK